MGNDREDEGIVTFDDYLAFLDQYWELFELTYRDPKPDAYRNLRL